MARLMSVSHTTDQVRARTKTVTRRLGWKHARPGQQLRLVEKSMGLKKGESVVDVARVEIVAVSREMLGSITQDEVDAEGFPSMTPQEFVEWFAESMGCDGFSTVTRIEWRYLS